MRLFAAIRPPQQVLSHLELALSGYRSGIGSGLRWVPQEQLHITVAFFGEVPNGAVGDIEDELTAAAGATGPLDLSLRGAGSFADRSLWIGVTGEIDPLRALMARCSGIHPVDRQPRHRAHLTVARPSKRSRGTDLATMVHALSVYNGPGWTAADIALFSSELGQGRGGGPLHEMIRIFTLGG